MSLARGGRLAPLLAMARRQSLFNTRRPHALPFTKTFLPASRTVRHGSSRPTATFGWFSSMRVSGTTMEFLAPASSTESRDEGAVPLARDVTWREQAWSTRRCAIRCNGKMSFSEKNKKIFKNFSVRVVRAEINRRRTQTSMQITARCARFFRCKNPRARNILALFL